MVKSLMSELLKTKGRLYVDLMNRKSDETEMDVQVKETSVDIAGEPDPLTYSWRNVSVYFSHTKRSSEVPILKGVSGICRPGELLAIMGASGAGKTTLLNVLTHRNNDKLRIVGDLFVNGRRVDPDSLTSRSAYVQQDDLFIGTLTVREQLIFQALVRMDRHVTYEERIKRVDQVLMELGLVKCENSLIGEPGISKSISGGERKRLSFACEILTNPSLMFCDEPTSGLDSFMAQNVVAVMRNMAERGKTIITTIHQPSSEVFSMFDRLLLMAEGRVAFLGEVSAAIKFFESLDLNCPKQHNPADFFIDQLSVQPGKEFKCIQKVNNICDAFHKSSYSEEIKEAVLTNEKSTMHTYSKNEKHCELSPYRASWSKQLRAVTWRSWLEVVREPFLIKVRFLQILAIALLVGGLYFDQYMDEVGVFNINGALFLLLTNMTFQNCSAVVKTFCAQKHLFLREHFNGMYRTDVYFLAKNVVEFPFFALYSFLYTGVIYFMIGLNPAMERFLVCVLVAVLVGQCAVSFGYFLSCMAGSVSVALTLMGPMIIPMLLFGGFFLHEESTPIYMVWIKYLSWFNYGNEALIVNQWDGITNITCSGTQNCYPDGATVLAHFSYSKGDLWWDIAFLGVLAVAYRFVAFLLLLIRTHRTGSR